MRKMKRALLSRVIMASCNHDSILAGIEEIVDDLKERVKENLA